jgi:hypothetical protein
MGVADPYMDLNAEYGKLFFCPNSVEVVGKINGGER